MTYDANSDLPPHVREAYSDRCQTVFREVWNKTNARTGEETTSFAEAHTAAKACEASTRTDMTAPAIRTVSETDDVHVIEGLLSLGSRDTYGTYFSARTDWGFDLHPSGIPVLYNHGFEPDFGLKPVGMTTPPASFRSDEDGIWVQMQLDKRNAYYATRIKPLLDEGALGISQGSAEHSVQIDARTGEVLAWPLHEVSLTPTNSNWLNTIAARTDDTLRIIASRAQESTADQNDLPDSAFAYIEPGGKKDEGGKTTPRSLRHFPIHDAAHTRNALSRAPQSPFGEKAMPAIKAAAKKFGIDQDDSARTGARAGARHSATDQGHVNAMHAAALAMHSHSVALGATNHDDGDADEDDDEDAARSDQERLTTIRIVGRQTGDAVRADLLELARSIGREQATKTA